MNNSLSYFHCNKSSSPNSRTETSTIDELLMTMFFRVLTGRLSLITLVRRDWRWCQVVVRHNLTMSDWLWQLSHVRAQLAVIGWQSRVAVVEQWRHLLYRRSVVLQLTRRRLMGVASVLTRVEQVTTVRAVMGAVLLTVLLDRLLVRGRHGRATYPAAQGYGAWIESVD